MAGQLKDREKGDEDPRRRMRRTTVGRIICSSGKNDGNGNTRERILGGAVNFSTRDWSFSSSFSVSFPYRPFVSLERIIPRYELGIYNYTGAVIGFRSFFRPSIFSSSLFLSLPSIISFSLFSETSREVPRFSLYRKAD